MFSSNSSPSAANLFSQFQAQTPDHYRSLFLGDLACFCTEQDVVRLFQKFGSIETVRLMRGKEQKCLGYGFITFADVRGASAALEANGSVLVGRPIK